MSLHLSKFHIIGNHMSQLNCQIWREKSHHVSARCRLKALSFSLAYFPSVSAPHQPGRSGAAFFYADSVASVTTVDRQ